jgi:hypothetical protein
MSIKFNEQEGLSDETVRKLNDLFRGYQPEVDRPTGVDRIAQIMYYDKNNEPKLTKGAIEGLNRIFDEQTEDGEVKENRDKFFKFMFDRGAYV